MTDTTIPAGGKGALRLKLRDYQERAVEEVKAAYRAGKRAIVLVCPTGGGKTLMGSRFALGSVGRGARQVWWLAHRDELVTQARDRLLAEGAERVGIIAAGYQPSNAPLQVASIQTLVARASKGLPTDLDLIVYDECHHAPASTWLDVVRAMAPKLLIGLTATPERGDGRALGVEEGGLFDHMVQVSSVRELQSLGYLVPCVTYAPASYRKQLAQDPVAAHLSRAPGERTVVFCQGVTHAEKTVLAFQAQGIHAASVHGETPSNLRAARLAAFQLQDRAPLLAAGYLEPAPLVLCTPFVLTEGWDCPEAACCILARGCGHPGMMLQMVGRVLRPAEGKTRAVFVDLQGITQKRDRKGRLKIGLPEADRTWSLKGKAVSLSEADEDSEGALKPCPACEAMVMSWATDREGWRICPICRERVQPPAAPQVQPRELHQHGTAADPEVRARALRGLAIAAGRRSGNRAGWVAHRFQERFGDFPPRGAAHRALIDVGIEPMGPPKAISEPEPSYEDSVAEALRCG